jgi:hypothetical protein
MVAIDSSRLSLRATHGVPARSDSAAAGNLELFVTDRTYLMIASGVDARHICPTVCHP